MAVERNESGGKSSAAIEREERRERMGWIGGGVGGLEGGQWKSH